MQPSFYLSRKINSFSPIYLAKSSNNDPERPPASEQLSPLVPMFRRRLLTGISTASLVAGGANFGGVTSFLLGLSPETARGLKLDVLYPIGGYSRCIEANEGFELIYPADWVGDQTLLYRAARKAEKSLDDEPPLSKSDGKEINESSSSIAVAFGPPGSNGELNVSVIVSQVPLDFRIEAFGEPAEVGRTIVQRMTGSSKRPDLKGTLIQSTLRKDSQRNIKYYTLEFMVDSPSYRRHNVSVCCARAGRLFTLNAQAPESLWPKMKTHFYRIAESFALTS